MQRLSDDELFTLPMTFMGAPYGRPGPGSKAAVLGIPFDCGTNMRIGARGGPDSVREKSQLMRRFNRGEFDFVAVGRAMIAEPDWPKLVQAGKLDQLKPFSPSLMADPLVAHINA